MTLTATSIFPSNIFHATLGALFVGFACSCGVFGVLTQQTITYYQRYFHDRMLYKVLVAVLWALEFMYVVFIGYAIYFYVIIHYGDFVFFLTEEVHWTLVLQVFIGALVGVIVKSAFAMRVWTFSKKNIFITGFIALLIIAQTGLAIVYTVRAFQLRRLEHADQLKVIATLSLSAGVATDVVIAAALCYFLRKLKSGFKKSDSLVNKLSIYAINTGALTSALSAVTLILYNVYPDYFYFMGSYFVLGNLYAISFICTLNTRRAIRGKGTDNQNSTTENSRGGGAIFMITNPSSANRQNAGVNSTRDPHTISKGMEIGVRREITVLADIESGQTTHEGATPPSHSSSPMKSISPFR